MPPHHTTAAQTTYPHLTPAPAPPAGLRIQRMPSESNTEFGDPATYPYMVVASPSCHDTSTTRAWWEEDADRRERFYYQARGGSGGVVGTAEQSRAQLNIT